MASKYGTLGPTEFRRNGRQMTILIPHDLGLKFSTLMENGLDEFFRGHIRLNQLSKAPLGS
jgi:hypothetical protein